MCKMDSSTESDSEISPRWSDTSALGGCVSSAPGSRTSRRTASLTYKSAERHPCCSLFLDPYDGSSEDSDESNGGTSRRTRRHSKGGYGLHSQRRRLLLHPCVRDPQSNGHNGVRMSYGSELWGCEAGSDERGCRTTPEKSLSYAAKDVHPMDVEVQPGDPGSDTTRSSTCWTPGPPFWEERSASPVLSSCWGGTITPLCKRKEAPPGAELEEAEPRKRQRVKNMEDDREEAG